MAFDESGGDAGGDVPPAANEKPDFERQIHMEIARTFAKAPKYTQESLKTDRDLLLRVVREHREGWRMLKVATQELRADRDLLVATIKGSAMGWRALAFAADHLREDRDLCLEAVRRNAAALEMVASHLRQDSDFVSEALASIQRRMKAETPKAAAQDWAAGHTAIKSKNKKKGSVLDSLHQDPTEEWTERLRRETDVEKEAHCRVMPLCCVRITQSNGLVLAALGKIDNDWSGSPIAKAKCQLPGTRILDGEQPRDTLNRFLHSTFAPLAKGLELDSEFQVMRPEEGVSLKYGVRTRYLRSVFNATADSKFQWNKVVRRLAMSPVWSPRATTKHLTLGRRFGAGAMTYSHPRPPDVFILPGKDSDSLQGGDLPVSKSVAVYSWIPLWEFDWLRSSDVGRETLKTWLSMVNINVSAGSRVTLGSSALELPGLVSRSLAQSDHSTETDASSQVDSLSDRMPNKVPPIVSARQANIARHR